jgi:hypothetical protein
LPVVIVIIISLTTGTGLVWLIVDIRHKRSAFPMAVFVGIGVIAVVLGVNGHSAWWQVFAKGVVTTLF